VADARKLRGRQAEAARNDRRVLAAARAVFAEQGFDAPITAVAEQAGVGVGSLYRRYGGKQELLQHVCVLALEQNLAAARAALDCADPWESLSGYIRECVGISAGAFARIAGHIEATDEMSQLARAVLGAVDQLAGRAHDAGALRPDATTMDVIWLIEHFGRGFHVEDVSAVRERQLAISLAGLRTTDAGPLGPPTPSAADYLARWELA